MKNSNQDYGKNDVININGKKFETIDLEGDLFPNWYNQRMRNNYQHLFDLLERKKFIYNRAGDYYRKMNLYFVIPSILITTISKYCDRTLEVSAILSKFESCISLLETEIVCPPI